ncbi:MAG: SPOR domain-containing protein [Desulfovibrio sp.]|nr:MAG: SPOR domain-containing protein [Desulfovibrio sp.]
MIRFLCIAVLVGVGCLFVMAPGQALGQDVSIEMVAFGEFKEAEGTTGVNDWSTLCPEPELTLVASGDVILAAPMARMGFEFVLRGLPEGELVPLTVQVRFPAAFARSDENWEILVCPGQTAHAAWRFPRDRGIEQGVWVVELLHEGRLLGSQVFDVTPLEGFGRALPQAAGATAENELRTAIGPESSGASTGLASGGSTLAVAGGAGPASWSLSPSPTGIHVQVSACLVPDNAYNDAEDLEARGYPVYVRIVEDRARGRTWHVVRLGDFSTRSDAERAMHQFIEWEDRPAFVVD